MYDMFADFVYSPVAIVIIVAIVVVVVIAVNGGFNNNAKRSISALAESMEAGSISRVMRARMNRPGIEWQPGAYAARDTAAADYARRMDVPPVRW